MRFARPVDGFRLKIAETVATLVGAECAQNAEFQRYWEDILERLRFTAHRDGVEEPRLGKGYRLFVSHAVEHEGRPRVVVGYLVLGDTVSISLVRIAGR